MLVEEPQRHRRPGLQAAKPGHVGFDLLHEGAVGAADLDCRHWSRDGRSRSCGIAHLAGLLPQASDFVLGADDLAQQNDTAARANEQQSDQDADDVVTPHRRSVLRIASALPVALVSLYQGGSPPGS